MKKSIYCNCGTYLGERDGFDVIRCKKCGIDYVVKSEKGFWDYYKTHDVVINTQTREDYENLMRAICKETGDINEEVFYKLEENTCIRLCKKNMNEYEWLYDSKSFYEEEGYQVISYQSIKSLIEKGLDK